MSAWTAILMIAGLLLLAGGAELLVRGASRLALSLGVTPVVIGLTVVSIGTSAPELVVSIGAALQGRADLTLGNVVGSNIVNTLVILGACAVILPLTVKAQFLRRDLWLMVGTSLLPLVFGRDGSVGRVEGLFMIVLAVGYFVLAVRAGRREHLEMLPHSPAGAELVVPATQGRRRRDVLLLLIGLGMLLLGAKWLVDGAVELARAWGISELVIGLTIVAVGTSLPEVATSVVAALRGERDLAVGNVIGSNIFNILGVLGASAAASRGGVAVSATALRLDIPVMIAVCVVCLPVFYTGRRIARGEGLMLLGYYVAYTAYLVLNSRHDAGVASLRDALFHFALPITVLALLITIIVEVRRGSVAAANGGASGPHHS